MPDGRKELWHRIGRKAMAELQDRGIDDASDKMLLAGMIYMGIENHNSPALWPRISWPWKLLVGASMGIGGVMAGFWDRLMK